MSRFRVIVLGCTGGPNEGNLSSYLLGVEGTDEMIAFDAGSLFHGLSIAQAQGSFSHLKNAVSETHLLQKYIKAYLISHPHLDHVAGLVIASQRDEKKSIYGLNHTLDALRDHLFNGKIWPNYGNEGVDPASIYTYVHLKEGEENKIAETNMTVEAFQLVHAKNCPSTAFLVEYQNQYVLYFGDTSSDLMEKGNANQKIWEKVAPIAKKGALKGIFLECSFPKGHEKPLYGHLNPTLFFHEMHILSKLSNQSIADLKVIVTHRKESVKNGISSLSQIEEELNQLNDLNLNLIFPKQGSHILL